MKPPALLCLTVLAGLFCCVLTSGCAGLALEKGPAVRYLDAVSYPPVPSPAATGEPETGTAALNATGDSPPPGSPPAADFPEVPAVYTPLSVPLRGLPDENRTYAFRFRDEDYTVRLPVNMSLYHAANESTGTPRIIDDKEIGLFYRLMTEDPAMDPFYSDLSDELRMVRYRAGNKFTDDDYLEYLVSFVQQIPYDDTSPAPRYPVEVVYEQQGDSGEKAILLTGLLAREGYRTALLVFPARNHATAGIGIHLSTRNPTIRVFTGSGQDYLYIDTTTSRLIGICPEEYGTVQSVIVVPVGNGTNAYGKVGSLASIVYDLNTIKTNIHALEEREASANESLPQWDHDSLVSYRETYDYLMGTNDRLAAEEAIRESELPHHSACMCCS